MIDSSRPPAVAGLFYPGDAGPLRAAVRQLLEAASTPSGLRPKVLIVPHAGYPYSGETAATAYARLLPYRNDIRRVVLLGPAHRVAVRGLAAPDVQAFATPLGKVPLDVPALRALRDLPQVCQSDLAHAGEHSLEVQLPFLQEALGTFTLVPLVVGDASPGQIAGVLDRLWGGDETLIVISSDLSHFLPHAVACARDELTAETILQLRPELDHEQACGATPINGLLEAARSRRLRPQLLDLRNSGDTAGDKARVVGYGAFAFHESANPG
jgi:MEMO1 family protein